MSLLDVLLLLPLAGFLLTLLAPAALSRVVALAVSAVTFVVSILVAATFLNSGQPSLGTDFVWITTPNIHYHVAVDGLSLWLVLLTTLLTPLAVLVSWSPIQHRTREFYAFLLLLEFSLIGVFSALDLFLFYVFFELALVPMIFLIGIYGGPKRIAAATKFFLYTLFGSLLMLGAMIFIYLKSDTFDYTQILIQLQTGKLAWAAGEAMPLFLAFFLAFAIKLALFPVHTWLPDAYTEAPTAGTFMLAAVMTKMGTYGLIRFCLPLFPGPARECANWIVVLAIIGIIYGALLALVQQNMKRLVAYSSISHIGFIVLGIFSFTQAGLDGAVYQMVAHGISTGALFLLIGMLQQRQGSLDIGEYGGVATSAPGLATIFSISMLASIGLPSLCNFIGEYLVLQGAAQVYFRLAVFAAIGVILSACYLLWMYQRTFFGPPKITLPDLTGREYAALVPLVIMMAVMGVATQIFLPSISAANTRVLEQTKMGQEYQVKHAAPRQETADAR